jgi:hypothetical protein
MRALRWVLLLVVMLPWLARGQEAADEQILKQERIGSDDASLIQYFRNRTLTEPQRARIDGLIRQLRDDSFDVREIATSDLLELGGSVAPLLQQAAAAPGTEVEVVRRVERILQKLNAPGSETSCAAVRLLAARRPMGAAGILLDYLPFADDDSVVETVREALAGLALRDGQQEPALVAALEDRDPHRRAAVVEALVRAGTPDQRVQLRRFLQDPDSEVRLLTAMALARAKERDAIPVLIQLLADLSPEQAWRAEDILCRLADEDGPAVPLGTDPAGRLKCRDAWANWWANHQAAVDLDRLDPAGELGYTLLTQLDPRGIGRVLEIAADGKPRWQIDNLRYPVDARVLRNDRVLIAEYNGNRVTERNFKGDILWSKAVSLPNNVQRLPNGQTFIACQNQLLLVNLQGNEVFRHPRPAHDVLSAQRLRNGQYFIITNRGLAVRLDSTGKEIRQFASGPVQQFVGLDVLPAGKFLVPQTAANQVVELDADGKVSWKAPVPLPISAVRLSNGHTLVASFQGQRVVELDKAGKQVQEIKPDGRPWKARRR